MSERLRKALIYSSLVIAIAWAWSNWDSSDEPYSAGRPDTPVVRTQEMVDSILKQRARSTTLDSFPNPGWGDDPFRRRVVRSEVNDNPTPTDDNNRPRLTAISSRGDRSMAIINGRIVEENGYVGSWHVRRIGSSEVQLSRGPESMTLTLSRRSGHESK